MDQTKDKEILAGLCRTAFNEAPAHYELLASAGGDRKYYRLSLPGRTVLGVVADNRREAESYVKLTEVFRNAISNGASFRVPEVFGCTLDYSHYLVEDLGAVSLFDRLGSSGISALVGRSLSALVAMQTLPQREWEDAVAYTPLSRRLIMWDLNYFKYEFLKNAGVDFDEGALEDDFERICSRILALPPAESGFMMRDCQSRNIMLSGQDHSTPFFIDFQGGRRGPLLYDAVSLLWQAKAGFTPEFRDEMLNVYARCLAETRNIPCDSILDSKGLMALFRTLQVLGAYGYRGLVQKRAHFLTSIPGAISNLSWLLQNGELNDYPQIADIAGKLAKSSRFLTHQDSGHLVVTVFSFSYKKGYPEDLTGNGGGFMFDCRGMHNPGRYDEYKPLTGRDRPVIEFLQSKGEADEFARKAVELVSPTVKRYIKRGFSSLQIGFGCTGGRHRSVYCAESAARELSLLFPDAEIRLVHREQGITEIFNHSSIS